MLASSVTPLSMISLGRLPLESTMSAPVLFLDKLCTALTMPEMYSSARALTALFFAVWVPVTEPTRFAATFQMLRLISTLKRSRKKSDMSMTNT